MLISHDKDVTSFLQLTKMHNNNRMSVEFLHIETKPSTQQTSSDEFVRFSVHLLYIDVVYVLTLVFIQYY